MEKASLPEGENPRDRLRRLIEGELDALRDLGALLEADPWPRPSALALQVALCNRRRLRTIAGIERCTGYSLRRVTPVVLRSAGSTPGGENESADARGSFRQPQPPTARNPEEEG